MPAWLALSVVSVRLRFVPVIGPLMVAVLKVCEMVASAARMIVPLAVALRQRFRAPRPPVPLPLRVMALSRLFRGEALAEVEGGPGGHRDVAVHVGKRLDAGVRCDVVVFECALIDVDGT
jgi:hypothetical protein